MRRYDNDDESIICARPFIWAHIKIPSRILNAVLRFGICILISSRLTDKKSYFGRIFFYVYSLHSHRFWFRCDILWLYEFGCARRLPHNIATRNACELRGVFSVNKCTSNFNAYGIIPNKDRSCHDVEDLLSLWVQNRCDWYIRNTYSQTFYMN